jgi:hypothetical protein
MIQAARRVKLVGMVAVALFLGSPAAAQTPKSCGVINLMQREELAVGFTIHETATIATVWPALPCFNNLVVFDQLKRVESADTGVGSWPDAGGLARQVQASRFVDRPRVLRES